MAKPRKSFGDEIGSAATTGMVRTKAISEMTNWGKRMVPFR
jgi:hypothetical protein